MFCAWFCTLGQGHGSTRAGDHGILIVPPLPSTAEVCSITHSQSRQGGGRGGGHAQAEGMSAVPEAAHTRKVLPMEGDAQAHRQPSEGEMIPEDVDITGSSGDNVESVYGMGENLGKGSFAVVKIGRRRSDGLLFAVKIIDKTNPGGWTLCIPSASVCFKLCARREETATPRASRGLAAGPVCPASASE